MGEIIRQHLKTLFNLLKGQHGYRNSECIVCLMFENADMVKKVILAHWCKRMVLVYYHLRLGVMR
jgi:hypothetical protein